MEGDARIELEEALEDISLGEIRMAERHFGHVFGDDPDNGNQMTPMETLAMGIWSRERRLRPNGGFQLADADKMSLKAAGAYFDEPVDIDADAPDSDQGKDDSTDDGSPVSEPSSEQS